MNPAARVKAAIDILDLVIAAAREGGAAADTIIANWAKANRYAGSADRRAIRDQVYAAIRAFGVIPASGRAAILGLAKRDKALAACFDGSAYGPQRVIPGEQRAAPSALAPWLAALIAEPEHSALLDRAPFDLRVNGLLATRDSVIGDFPGAEPIAGTAHGLRLPANIVIDRHPAYAGGLVEVQDGGSQLVAQLCAARAGMVVIDLCAGAGGKTLALAADMGWNGLAAGRLIATDTNRDRLQRLPDRLQRAGAGAVETRLLDPGDERAALGDLQAAADLVVIDAPCSGSGTWRRNPEARWRLTPKRLTAVCETQSHVLALGASLVQPGGALVYAVCSVIAREGRDQIDAFLTREADWRAEPIDTGYGRPDGAGISLTPSHDHTDGFFVARLTRWR